VPQNALTSRNYWAESKTGLRSGSIAFDPHKPIFRAHDRLFRKVLPERAGTTLLEVGCHPGQYLWYFYSRYGYRVSGIEYVDALAAETRENLKKAHVSARILNADLFAYATTGVSYDVVASFGFVEHFVDVRPAVAAHWALVRNGGYPVISVPNHAGWLGRLLKRLDAETAARHNAMGLEVLEAAVRALPNAEVVRCAHLGGVGFWNCGLYAALRERWPRAHRLLAAPFKLVEYLAPLVPESARLSPNLIAIVRKRVDAGR